MEFKSVKGLTIDQDILLPHKIPLDIEAFLGSFINTTFVEST